MSEIPEAPAPAPADEEPETIPAPVMEAMKLMEIAMNTLSPEERKEVIRLKKEVDDASKSAGEHFDHRLEFCYAIKFSQDKIKSTRMLNAVEAYIRAVEG